MLLFLLLEEFEVLLSHYTRISMGTPHMWGSTIAMAPRTETRNWLLDMGFG